MRSSWGSPFLKGEASEVQIPSEDFRWDSWLSVKLSRLESWQSRPRQSLLLCCFVLALQGLGAGRVKLVNSLICCGTAQKLPQELRVPQPWQCPGPGWMGQGAEMRWLGSDLEAQTFLGFYETVCLYLKSYL